MSRVSSIPTQRTLIDRNNILDFFVINLSSNDSECQRNDQSANKKQLSINNENSKTDKMLPLNTLEKLELIRQTCQNW